jgi:hypothetical protein
VPGIHTSGALSEHITPVALLGHITAGSLLEDILPGPLCENVRTDALLPCNNLPFIVIYVRFGVLAGVVVDVTVFGDVECRGSRFLRNVAGGIPKCL